MLGTAQATSRQTRRRAERTVEGMTREEVCRRYHRKVLLLARQVSERLPPEATLQNDDLVSCGAIGLLEAFDRFDASKGIRFSTFAEYRIRGAMLDALRSNDTFTRRRRQLARRIENAVQALERRNGRTPEPREVAEELDMSLDRYQQAIDRVKPVSHLSIDAVVGDEDDGRPLVEQLVTESGDPTRNLDIADVKRLLGDAVLELPERERQCVMMYYGKDLSLAEIAEVFGVTPSRISQVLSAARRRLRKKLSPVIGRADLGLDMT